MNKYIIFLLVLLGVCTVALCGSVSSYAANVTVTAGIPPMEYLAEEIGGSGVVLHTLLVGGQDPHTFEPAPKAIKKLAESQLYISAGLQFEKKLREKMRDVFPHLTVLDLAGKSSTHGEDHKSEQQSEHEDGHHSDPHNWLSPDVFGQQAQRVADALCHIDAGHCDQYKANLAQFMIRLATVTREIKRRLAPFRGRTFYVVHPAFAAFAQPFGLHQKAVEFEGKRPGPKTMARLIRQAQAEGAQAIFSQPQFDQTSSRVLAQAVGAQVVPLDPLARDVLANYRHITKALEGALQ